MTNAEKLTWTSVDTGHDETKGVGGMDVIARTTEAIYLRIPEGMQRVIEGGCECPHCKRTGAVSRWDTLVVPVRNPAMGRSDYAHTVHMPDPQTFLRTLSGRVRRNGMAV